MPAPIVSAGSAAWSAQLLEVGAEDLRAAGCDGMLRSRKQPAVEVDQLMPQLPWAKVRRLLDTRRLDRAAAALDAVQEQAEQAEAQLGCMVAYLGLLGLRLSACSPGLAGEASLLWHQASRWIPEQEAMTDSLKWAAGESKAQLDRIRGGWEGRLQACFGGEGKTLQVDGEEACVVVRKYADVIASMQACYGRMQERFASLLQSLKARQQFLGATIYGCIRLVSCRMSPCGVAVCWHGLV